MRQDGLGWFLLVIQTARLYIFLLAFQWRQFHPNPIFEQKVMIETLEGVRTAWPSVRTINCNRLSKIVLKASISRPRLDGVALASGWLHFFWTTCLTKDSFRTGTPHRPDGLQLSSHICVRTVLPRRPDGWTWTLDSSRTLNSVQTICHYVRTDAILNSSKFLDTDRRPDRKFSSSGQEHHIVRTVAWDPTSLSWNLHIIFLENWNSFHEACDICNLS
jgi:hypothetical protein